MTEGKQQELLARIDERTERLQEDFQSLRQEIVASYVTRAEFDPVKKIVYGMVSLIMISVGAAIIALVVHSV